MPLPMVPAPTTPTRRISISSASWKTYESTTGSRRNSEKAGFAIVHGMKRKRSAPVIVPVIVLIVLAGVLAAQSSSVNGRRFANPYLTMTVASGWTERPPADKELSLVKSKYVLTINPVFDHASGVEGGRFSEIVQGMPSVDAVMGNVDQPASGAECSLSPSESLQVTKEMRLGSLYTDSSKTKNGCSFPAGGLPAWFGSFTAGDGPESEYTITLSYATPDVNSLPRKGSRQLTQTFAEVVSMLKTLHLIPPIVIAKISPQSAAPWRNHHDLRQRFHALQFQGDRNDHRRRGGSQPSRC